MVFAFTLAGSSVPGTQSFPAMPVENFDTSGITVLHHLQYMKTLREKISLVPSYLYIELRSSEFPSLGLCKCMAERNNSFEIEVRFASYRFNNKRYTYSSLLAF
jgi:hypothetical protein